MKLEAIPKDGTTLTRKAFWDKVAEAVNASQKRPGKNISVDVHDGYGSVINVNPQRQGSGSPPPPSICATNETLCVTFSGIQVDCGCFQASPGVWLNITDIDVNGAFPVTYSDIGIGSQWEAYGGSVHIKKYANIDDCSNNENLILECDEPMYITVQCLNEGVNPASWRVTYNAGDPFGIGTCHDVLITSSNWYVFGTGTSGEILPLPTDTDNLLDSCGAFVIPDFFSGTAIGRIGAAHIETGSC